MKILRMAYNLATFAAFAIKETARFYLREFGIGGAFLFSIAFIFLGALFCSCHDTTTGPQQTTTAADAEKEEIMGKIVFVNFASFTLPVSPGAVNTAPTFSFQQFFGTKSPKIGDPSSTENTVWGCDPAGTVTLNRVRSYVLGTKGLRPGIPASGTVQNYALISFQRTMQGFTGSLYGVPLSLNEEWQEVGVVFNGMPVSGLMQPILSQVYASFDTRLLDASYYGTSVKLGIELDCDCVLKGF